MTSPVSFVVMPDERGGMFSGSTSYTVWLLLGIHPDGTATKLGVLEDERWARRTADLLNRNGVSDQPLPSLPGGE